MLSWQKLILRHVFFIFAFDVTNPSCLFTSSESFKWLQSSRLTASNSPSLAEGALKWGRRARRHMIGVGGGGKWVGGQNWEGNGEPLAEPWQLYMMNGGLVAELDRSRRDHLSALIGGTNLIDQWNGSKNNAANYPSLNSTILQLVLVYTIYTFTDWCAQLCLGTLIGKCCNCNHSLHQPLHAKTRLI